VLNQMLKKNRKGRKKYKNKGMNKLVDEIGA
jgi:hypothetical protein